MIISRRARARWFDQRAFGEPAWDILLVLYDAELHQRSLPMTEVGRRAGIPSTSLTRWIEALLGWGMIDRLNDPLDRRTSRISLTHGARERIEAFCAELLASAPPPTDVPDRDTPPADFHPL